MGQTTPPKWLLALTFPLWFAAVASGVVYLTLYKMQPGVQAHARDSGVHEPLPVLMVFLHPRCPCGAATLSELERTTSYVGKRMIVQAVIVYPKGGGKEWTDSAIAKRAKSLPGAQIVWDEGGVLSTRLGVSTSGQVLLYSRQGKLVFEGGITASRSHEGANTGEDNIEEYIRSGRVFTGKTPVFGCSLGDLGYREVNR